MIPTQQPPARRPRRYTEGATLIVVVLFTMLILSLIMVATLRLSLSTRTSGTDQKAILQSQYSAESNLALMRSQIQDMQSLLSADSIAIPASTTGDIALTWANNFCGTAAGWSNATQADFTQLDGNDTSTWTTYFSPNINTPRKCAYTKTNSSSQFDVLGNIVTPSAITNILPSEEQPDSYTQNNLDNWWRTKLDNPISVGNGSYKITPIYAFQLDSNNYRFYFKVTDLTSISSNSTNKRIISGAPSSSGIWWFQLSLPSLLTNVLMTNHHQSGRYTSGGVPNLYFQGDQVFDGDVFTNEKFLFSSSSRAVFRGNVASAGCTNLPASGQPIAANGDCNHTPGVYTSAGNYIYSRVNWNKTSPLTRNNKIQYSNALRGYVDDDTGGGVTWNTPAPGIISPDFTAAYKALPSNSIDQSSKATASGLVVPNADNEIYLFAGDSSASPFSSANSSYNPTSDSWSEPATTYQYIYMRNSGTNDTSNMYRIDANDFVYKYNSSGRNWSLMTNKFNGYIYSGNPNPITIYAPPRLNGSTSGDLRYIPPALASFSNMSITSLKGMNIQSDLVMSNSPCANNIVGTSDCVKDAPVLNVLGLFAPTGNISIGTLAPRNVNIHAALMASGNTTTDGQIRVTNYDDENVGPRGDARIIGSLIENLYGAFGQFNPRTGAATAGYNRDYHFDPRFISGVTPRGFPVSPTWTAYDANHNMNSGSDSMDLSSIIWQQGTQ